MSKYFSEVVADPETLRPGSRLASLRKSPGRVEIVLFCSASRNFHRVHYDEAYARAQGLKEILVPGFLLGNWCLEVVTRSFPRGIVVRRLKFKNSSPAYAGETFEIAGEVDRVGQASGHPIISCRVGVEDSAGRLVTTGEVDVECRPPSDRSPEP